MIGRPKTVVWWRASSVVVPAVAVVLALRSGALAAASPPAILVLDFQAPKTAEWDWAGRGMAELTVENLSGRGLPTVDRDLLTAVLGEHDLAGPAGGGTAHDGLRAGAMLGAAFLLSGAVEPSADGGVRLSATLIRVETMEQVGACVISESDRRKLPEGLDRLLDGLTTGSDLQRQAPERQAIGTKPEALLYFQQGLEACAVGKPALAYGFFRMAQVMDKRLRPALDWEARACEMGGLRDHAAALRKHFALAPAMDAPSGSQAVSHVVSVLPTVLTSGDGLPADAQTLRQAIEDAVLSVQGLRLHRPERLLEAVAEQDRQLDAIFSHETRARYARWLSSDVMLYSVLATPSNGVVRLDVGTMDVLMGRRQPPATMFVKPDQALPAIAKLAVEALRSWQRSTTMKPAEPAARCRLEPLSLQDLNGLPDYRGVVAALDARMRDAATPADHGTLAEAYAQRGILVLADKETAEMRRKQDALLQQRMLQAKQAQQAGSATLADARKLADAYAARGEWTLAMTAFDNALGLAESATNNATLLHGAFVWAGAFMQSAPDTDPARAARADRVAKLRDQLFRLHLDSAPARALLATSMAEARRAAQEAMLHEQWTDCRTQAAAARQALGLLDQASRKSGRAPLFNMRLDVCDDQLATLLAHCLMMEGVAAARQGDVPAARDLLQRALDTDCEFGLRSGVMYGNRLSQKEKGFRAWASTELAWLPLTTPRIATVSSNLAERIRLLSDIRLLTDFKFYDANLDRRLVEAVARVWNDLPPVATPECPLRDHAAFFVDGLRPLPRTERQDLLRRLSRAYLKVTAADPDDLSACSVPMLIPRLKQITTYHRLANMEAEGLAYAMPFAERGASGGHAIALIEALFCDNALTVPVRELRRSDEPRNPKRWRVIGSGMQPCDGTLHAQMLQVFSRRSDVAGVGAALARLWARLAGAANPALHPVDGNLDRWYELSLKARSCDPACIANASTADSNIATLAAASNVPDMVGEAIRLKTTLGLPPRPPSNDSWYWAGQSLMEQFDYEGALRALRQFRKGYDTTDHSVNSRLWSLLFLEGQALAATGRPAEAAADFRKLAQELGTRTVPLWGHRRAFVDTGPLPLGVLAAEAVSRLHLQDAAPDMALAQTTRPPLAVERLMDGASRGDSDAKLRLFIQCVESGTNYIRSVVWARAVCGTNPTTPGNQCLLALALLDQGQHGQASQLLEQAKKASAGGGFEYWLPHMGGTMTREASGPVLLVALAAAYEGAGQKEKAFHALCQARGYEKDPRRCKHLEAEIERVWGRPLHPTFDGQDFAHAYRRYRARQGGYNAQWSMVREALDGTGDIAEALTFADRIIESRPESSRALAMKAALLQKAGQPAAALSLLRDVLRMDAHLLEGRYTLWRALVELGDTDRANEEWRTLWTLATREMKESEDPLHCREQVFVHRLDMLHLEAEKAKGATAGGLYDVPKPPPAAAAGTFSPSAIISGTDATLDLGTVSDCAPIGHDFVVTNVGAAPLLLQSPSLCEDARISLPGQPVAPGEACVIRFELHPRGRRLGPLRKVFHIATNDPQQPDLRLCVTGAVLAVKPPSLRMRVLPDTPTTCAFTIGGPAAAPIMVKSVRTHVPWLTAAIGSSTNDLTTIQVSTVPPVCLGLQTSAVEVVFQDDMPNLVLPVSLFCREAGGPLTPNLHYHPYGVKRGTSFFSLSATNGQPFRITGIALTGLTAGLDYDTVAKERPRIFLTDLTLTNATGTIAVSTDHPDCPKLKVLVCPNPGW